MKTLIKLAILVLPLAVHAEVTTGWCYTENNGASEKSMANIGDFLNPEYWVGGNVNGVFSADLPKLCQYGGFSKDYRGTFDFSYSENYTFLTFQSDSLTPRVINLTGDFLFRPTATGGKVTFGNSDARKTIDFDLGGQARRFYVKGNMLNLYSAIKNGDVRLEGEGGVLNIVGQGYVEGNVDVAPNMTLAFGYASSSKEGRVGDIALNRANLTFLKPNGNYVDTIGTVTVKGAGSASVLQLQPNGKTMTLNADALVLEKGAVLAVQPDGLASTAVLKFVQAPETVGGIVPGLVVGASSTAAVNGANKENYMAINLAKYDASEGLKVLSDADYATEISSEADVDLKVAPGTTVAVNERASVNSLVLSASNYRDASQKVTGEGVLSVKSGMVFCMGVKSAAKVDTSLDFGSRMGYVIVGGPDGVGVDVTKPFYGTGGIVLSKLFATSYNLKNAMSSSLQGVNIATTAEEGSYTGDTYIQGPVKVNNSPFLPHGARKGNVIVNAWLGFNTISINGLYGSGIVSGTTLTVGEDGTPSDFDGEINVTTLNVAKGASIGGTGSISGVIVFDEGAKILQPVSNKAVKGPLSIDPTKVSQTVVVDIASADCKGAWPVLKAAEGATLEGLTFKRGENVGALTLSADKTELYASPKAKGFSIIIM